MKQEGRVPRPQLIAQQMGISMDRFHDIMAVSTLHLQTSILSCKERSTIDALESE